MVLLSLCTHITETAIISRGIGTIDQNRSLSSLYPDRLFSGANQSEGKDPGEVLCFSISVLTCQQLPSQAHERIKPGEAGTPWSCSPPSRAQKVAVLRAFGAEHSARS